MPRVCKDPSCVPKKRAIYNIVGLKPMYCKIHKTGEMVDVENPKCICGERRPIYNLLGENAAYCKECKTDKMVDVANPKCVCGKRPTFNFIGEKAMYCSECKTDEMINVTDLRCPCGKGYRVFNLPCEPKMFCGKCKTDEMVDVINKRCPGYDGVPCPTGYRISKQDYCLVCDPDPSRKIARKRDEHAFFEFLKKDGIDVTQREYRIDYRCFDTSRSHSFIDGIIISEDVVVCLELDEDAHELYDKSCEESRMHDASSELRLEFPRHSIAWARVNPHTKKDGVRDMSKQALKIRDRRHKEAAALIRDILKNPRDCIEYIGYPG